MNDKNRTRATSCVRCAQKRVGCTFSDTPRKAEKRRVKQELTRTDAKPRNRKVKTSVLIDSDSEGPSWKKAKKAMVRTEEELVSTLKTTHENLTTLNNTVLRLSEVAGELAKKLKLLREQREDEEITKKPILEDDNCDEDDLGYFDP